MRIITFSLCFLTALWNSGLLSWAMMLANHLETIWTAWNTLGSEGIFWKGKIKCISRAKGIWSGPIHISSFFMILWSMESMVAMVKWFSFADACSPAVLRSAQVSFAIQPLCLVARRSCLFAAVFFVGVELLNLHVSQITSTNEISSAQERWTKDMSLNFGRCQ